MAKSGSPYPEDLRAQLVDLVREGRTPQDLAEEFDPSAATIARWVRDADEVDKWVPSNVPFLEMAPVLAALFYAIGWAAATRFYGRFGVAPEDVGIDFSYMLVRVGFLLAAGAVMMYLSWLFLARVRDLSMSTRTARRLFTAGGWIVAAAALYLFVFSLRPWNWSGNIFLRVIICAAMVIVVYFVVMIVLLILDSVLGSQSPVFSPPDSDTKPGLVARQFNPRFLGAIFVVASAVTILVVPFYIAERAADSVESGEPYRVNVLPWIGGFMTDHVRLTTLTESDELAELEAKCLILLGSGDGFVVLYDDAERRTLKVPADVGYYTRGCD